MKNQFKHQNPTLTYQPNFNACKTIACSTQTNTPGNLDQVKAQFSNIKDSKSEEKFGSGRKTSLPLALIKEKMKQIDCSKQKKQNNGFDRVLALLKEQRDAISKLREQKRRCLSQLWRSFGGLMILQRQKFQSDYMAQAGIKTKQYLYHQLLSKNNSNIKALKQFAKKIELQSSQEKINSQEMLKNGHKRQQDQSLSLEYSTQDVIKQSKIYVNGAQMQDKPNKIQKISHKARTIKIRARPVPYRLVTNRTIHEDENCELKAKIDSTFKTVKRYETFGKNILNSIVFDPDSILSYGKRKHYIKNLEKRNYRKQEKYEQSAKILLRVGGIRLSLQDSNRYKTLQT